MHLPAVDGPHNLFIIIRKTSIFNFSSSLHQVCAFICCSNKSVSNLKQHKSFYIFFHKRLSIVLQVAVPKFNPLHHNISIRFLPTVHYTFPMVLTKRICLKSRASSVGDHFLYSHDLNVCFRADTDWRNYLLINLRA